MEGVDIGGPLGITSGRALAMGDGAIQTPLQTSYTSFAALCTKHTQRRLDDSTAHRSIGQALAMDVKVIQCRFQSKRTPRPIRLQLFTSTFN